MKITFKTPDDTYELIEPDDADTFHKMLEAIGDHPDRLTKVAQGPPGKEEVWLKYIKNKFIDKVIVEPEKPYKD